MSKIFGYQEYISESRFTKKPESGSGFRSATLVPCVPESNQVVRYVGVDCSSINNGAHFIELHINIY
jgi:hypothetical protein